MMVYPDRCWQTRKKNVRKRKRKITKIPVIISYAKRQRLKWLGHVKRSKAVNKAIVIIYNGNYKGRYQ